MDRLCVDLRHAWCAVRARPGATAATVLVLMLGVGLTAAMFALADPFLLKPLPYTDPNRLVVITVQPAQGAFESLFSPAPQRSMPTLVDLEARTDLFTGIAAYRVSRTLRLRLPQGSIALQPVEVTERLLDVLGLGIALPHSLTSTRQTSELPVLITARVFNQVFDNRHDVVGRTFARQDGGGIRVWAILPPTFLFPRDRPVPRIDALIPVDTRTLSENQTSPDGTATSLSPFTVVARLRAGVTPASARSALMARLPDAGAVQLDVQSITSYMTRRVRPLALGAVASGLLILLICAGNVANLLLARGAYRTREFALREAMGASRLDLARLVLAELALLTVGGSAGGLFVTRLALAASRLTLPLEYAALGEPSVTGRVLAFAGTTGLVIMVVGLIPAWVVWRMAPAGLVGQATVTETGRVRVLRFAMAASQSALAMMLLIGAALLGRSYLKLTTQETGFSGDVLALSTSYPAAHVGALLQRDIETTIERLQRITGVQSVAATFGGIIDKSRTMALLRVHGRQVPITPKLVTMGYFDAVGTRLLSGRALTPHDRNYSGIVVNESFAKRYWPDGLPIDQLVMLGAQAVRIVGVVHDTFDVSLDAPPEPTVFRLLENPGTGCVGACESLVTYIVHLSGRSRTVGAAAQRIVADVNPDSIVVETSSIRDRLTSSIKNQSFATLVLSFFAIAGLGVCAAGLVGIVAFVVARRTREIAICVAVGATPRHVLRMVLRQAVNAAAVGIVLGLVSGHWLSTSLERFLYGIQAGDWSTLALAGVGMLVIVSAAALIPARRALRLSPTDALRVE